MKWFHKSKYMVCPICGEDNHSHWLDTVLDWCSLPETDWFTTVSRSSPPQLADPCYFSDVLCFLLIFNGSCVIYNAGVDRNWKLKFMSLFDCLRKLWQKWQQTTYSKFCEKHDDKGHVRKLQIKYTIIIVVQYTIAGKCTFCFFNLTKIIIK